MPFPAFFCEGWVNCHVVSRRLAEDVLMFPPNLFINLQIQPEPNKVLTQRCLAIQPFFLRIILELYQKYPIPIPIKGEVLRLQFKIMLGTRKVQYLVSNSL